MEKICKESKKHSKHTKKFSDVYSMVFMTSLKKLGQKYPFNNIITLNLHHLHLLYTLEKNMSLKKINETFNILSFSLFSCK